MNNWVRVHENQAWDALHWAKEHCPTYITNDAEVEKINGEDYIYYYRFYFQTNTQGHREQTAFALRWA